MLSKFYCFAKMVFSQITNYFNKEDIFFNCTIITMNYSIISSNCYIDNNDLLIKNAMFVKNGVIEAIGDIDDVMQFRTNNTIIHDMNGKTIVPGFIESHMHADVASIVYDFVDLSGFSHSTNDDVWNHLRKSVSRFRVGEWIICKGLDHMLVHDLKTPTIDFLDKISPNNPLVIVSQVLHSYWANSMAFKLSGITKYTSDPSSGSYYEKNKNGTFTGLIVEQDAFNPIRKTMMKSLSLLKIAKNSINVMKHCSNNGNTSIVSAGFTITNKFFLYLFKLVSYPCIMFILNKIHNFFPIIVPRHFAYIDNVSADFLPNKNNGNPFFKILGIKMWYDGSPYVGSMYMSSNYIDSNIVKELHISNNNNKRLVDPDVFLYDVNKYDSLDWKMLVHTQGDLAIHETINAFSNIKDKQFVSHRHRLEHCLLLNKHLIDEMNNANLTPSFHINHIYYYGHSLPDIIGNELTQNILPINSFESTNTHYSLHSDYPMFDCDPLSLITTAVTRKTKNGTVIGENERISIIQALKSVTIMAAWQINMDHVIGSLEKGKYADFVVLDRNPLLLSNCPDEIRNIKISNVYINGTSIK